MSEDDNLVYDIESYWDMYPIPAKRRQQVFVHNEYKSLFRIVDFEDETISFNDVERINTVIDIHSKTNPEEIKLLMPKLLAVINAERPITMPYKPEKLTLYICKFDNVLGILYYRLKNKEEDNVYPIRRYFKSLQPIGYYEEITGDEYLNYYNKKFIRVKGD